jgi:hypothetical protein
VVSSRHPLSSIGRTITWWIIAALVSGAFALPLLRVLVTNAQYVLFANESVAYRYFLSVRILYGEGETAWLPQGQLVTLLQNGIVLWLSKVAGMPLGDIEHTLQPFGLATSAIVTALGVGILSYGITNRRFTVEDRLLVAFAALVPILVTRNSGFYYSTLPDYYFLTMVLVLAYLVFFIGLERMTEPFQWQSALWLGLFCGASLANKITLVSLTGIMAVQIAIVAYRGGLKRALLCLSAFGLAILAGFFAVFLAVYLGKVSAIVAVLRNWYQFGVNAGAEPNFRQFFDGLFVAYNYHLVVLGLGITYLYAIAITAIHAEDRRSRALRLCAIGLMTAFVFYAVYRRPAGTTLFEAMVILTGQAAMVLVILPRGPAVRQYTLVLVSAALFFALFTFDYALDLDKETKERAKRLADTAWQIHAATLEVRGPWVFLLPDNTYGWGGVEELILKGTSDMTWHEVDAAKKIHDEVAPGMIFRPWPDLADAHKAFLWINRADDRGNFVENSVVEAGHRASWAALEARAKAEGSRCREWLPVADHRVRLCVFQTSLAEGTGSSDRSAEP